MKGNMNSVFSTLGATNHSKGKRHPEDYYATEPKAVEMLLDLETFNPLIWECACGEGHISKVLEARGYEVLSSDLVDRGYGSQFDFLNTQIDEGYFQGDIITNPPYKYGKEFVEKALETVPEGNRVAMFLKLQFLESQKRRALFNATPPELIYVSSSRLNCAKNGDFETYYSSAIAHGWFIWRKGFTGEPRIRWFN